MSCQDHKSAGQAQGHARNASYWPVTVTVSWTDAELTTGATPGGTQGREGWCQVVIVNTVLTFLCKVQQDNSFYALQKLRECRHVTFVTYMK